MLPLRVQSNGQRIDALLASMDLVVGDADLWIQNVLANHIVLAGAGYVEDAVQAVLSEYGRVHGNVRIARFVDKTIKRSNSLNCEKIENILELFDKDLWPKIQARTNAENMSAVDSLKDLRDQIAHGKHNGTGYLTVKEYYNRSKLFVSDFAHIMTA